MLEFKHYFSPEMHQVQDTLNLYILYSEIFSKNTQPITVGNLFLLNSMIVQPARTFCTWFKRSKKAFHRKNKKNFFETVCENSINLHYKKFACQ